MSLLQPRLVVSNDLPDPPYPSDIRAKGWPFDVDLERVKQSQTWMRAPVDMRAHLLRLWAESWQQSPCGSLPADDEDLAAIIEMPVNLFAANRLTLLRGWVRHGDGRLYHRVLTEMVWRMMGKRRRDKERIALIRNESQRVATSRRESPAASASASASAVERVAVANAPAPTPAAKEKTERRKATRLPEGWFLPDEWRDWAVKVHGLDPQKAVRISLDFRDYWHAKAGAQACKLDWQATWRRWVRKECGGA